MTSEPESLILHLLREMRAEMADMRQQMATKAELAAIKSDMHSLRADVAADLIQTRRELSEQIVGLRRAVMDYHSTVIGHGVLIGNLEGRVLRMEQHLNLPSPDAH